MAVIEGYTEYLQMMNLAKGKLKTPAWVVRGTH